MAILEAPSANLEKSAAIFWRSARIWLNCLDCASARIQVTEWGHARPNTGASLLSHALGDFLSEVGQWDTETLKNSQGSDVWLMLLDSHGILSRT